jgi:hypothetical protein
MTPEQVLAQAAKQVKAVGMAVGVAGLVALIAIVARWGISLAVVVFGALVLLVLMVGLLLFETLYKNTLLAHHDLPGVSLAIQVFMWACLLLIIAVLVCLFTGVFFGGPVDLRWILTPAPMSMHVTPTPIAAPSPTPLPATPTLTAAASATVPLPVGFGPDPPGEIGEYGKRCEIDPATHELVLSVTGRPTVTPGQEYAGCCVLFSDLSPGGRHWVTVSIALASPERELHVKLENVSDGYQVAWLYAARIGAGTRTIEAAIDNPVLRQRVDKLCIAAKGGDSSIRNTIRVSRLTFR